MTEFRFWRSFVVEMGNMRLLQIKEHISISEMRARQLKKISGSIKLHTGDSLGKHAQMLKYQEHIVVVGGSRGMGKIGGQQKKMFWYPTPKYFVTSPPKNLSPHPQNFFCLLTSQNFFLPTTQNNFATTSPNILPSQPQKFLPSTPKFLCHSIHPQDILSPPFPKFFATPPQ